MNHVSAMTGTVLGGFSPGQNDECAHGAEDARTEGALAAFLSGMAAHWLARESHSL